MQAKNLCRSHDNLLEELLAFTLRKALHNFLANHVVGRNTLYLYLPPDPDHQMAIAQTRIELYGLRPHLIIEIVNEFTGLLRLNMTGAVILQGDPWADLFKLIAARSTQHPGLLPEGHQVTAVGHIRWVKQNTQAGRL